MVYEYFNNVHGVPHQLMRHRCHRGYEVEFLLDEVLLVGVRGYAFGWNRQIVDAFEEGHLGLKIAIEDIQGFVEVLVVDPDAGEEDYGGAVLELVVEAGAGLDEFLLSLEQLVG